MVDQGQILQYLKSNKQGFNQKYNLKKIGIFGSYARSEQTPDSDLDLLVEFEDNTPDLYEKKELIRNEMMSVFHLNVDICTEKYIKPIFRNHILSEAIYV